MAHMPIYHVVKGSQFGYLQDQFGPDLNFMAAYAAALNQLQNSASATTLETAANSKVSPQDVTHMKDHWFGSPGPWGNLAVPDTLRFGFIKAIEHAQSRQKPMEVIWICALDRAFHVYYCDSPNQVTVLIFTPPPDQGALTGQPLTRPENIWVVKLQENHDGNYKNLGPAIPDPVDLGPSTSGPTPNARIIWRQLFHS
jgi:hypothetical protein